LPLDGSHPIRGSPPDDVFLRRRSLADIEREYIVLTMEETEGNKSETADRLGIDRKTLSGKLAEYSWRDYGEVQTRYHNGAPQVMVPLPAAKMLEKVLVPIEGEERQSSAF
jgi:hypothetical protein